MARDDLHFRLRIPEALKVRVEAAAVENHRSITAEIVARLEASGEQTLRDRFAGHALIGMLANPEFKPTPGMAAERRFAAAAYIQADCMLAERSEAAPLKAAASADTGMLEALRAMRGWIQNWTTDKEFGLAPTAGSLAAAAATIDAAIGKAGA